MVMAAADFDALSCLLAQDQMLYVSLHEKHFAGRGLCSQMTEFVCSRPRGYKAISTCRDTWLSWCARETTVGLIVLYKMIFSHIIIIIIMQRS